MGDSVSSPLQRVIQYHLRYNGWFSVTSITTGDSVAPPLQRVIQCHLRYNGWFSVTSVTTGDSVSSPLQWALDFSSSHASFIPCGKCVLPQEQCYPCFPVRAKCWCVQATVWQCLGLSTCTQMLMHVIAHWGCTNTVRDSALQVDWGKNPLLHHGIEPVYFTWCFGLMLYQLGYIPTPPHTTLMSSSLTNKLPYTSITTANLPYSSITTAKLPYSSITTAKLPYTSITTAKLPYTSITTAKLPYTTIKSCSKFQSEISNHLDNVLSVSWHHLSGILCRPL